MFASLLIVLLAAKAVVLWEQPVVWSAATLVAYVWQDALVVVIFAAIETALARWRRGRLFTVTAYGAIVLYTALNVVVARVLSTPLTLPMIRAARGALADSIWLYLTPPNLATVAAIVAAGVMLPIAFSARARRPARALSRPTVLAMAALGIVAGAGATMTARVDTAGLHRNAVVALARSAAPRVVARAGDDDWTRPLFEPPPADDLSDLRAIAAGRNVVMISLESTAARYLRLYGGADDLTPRLDELARHAAVFDRAYAVTPESIKGLFSVLCSQYPAFDVGPAAYASAPCRSVARELSVAGYHTALFHSGRFAYLGMSEVIRDRGFDTLEDAGHIGGNHESSFGVDEPAAVARMLAWVDGLPAGEPFFLTYLPIAGHHPYATSEPGPFPDEDDFGRYRNAIHEGDVSIGTLIDGLRARGLEDDTLWIVYGDHGQAFGQHPGNYAHTFFLYDENVHVPFFVAAPGAIAGQRRSRTTVSLVDVAPTVLDLLGLPIPSGHQGWSALDAAPRVALFFTEYSLSLVGLRDGRWTFVHDLGSGRSSLFDVEVDPDESADLSSHHPARVAAYARVLRAWSAAQKARLD